MSDRFFLAVAGWEERFLLGCKNDISLFSPNKVLIIYSTEYCEWTKKNRDLLIEFCQQKGIETLEVEISFGNYVEAFSKLVGVLSTEIDDKTSSVRFNASTSPRDIIWSVLHYLDAKGIKTEFSYYRADSYGEWLSRDADVPRLVIKRSGIMYPDLQTCLLVLSGYDDHRLGQLIRKFEPRKVLVGVQTGNQLGNSERNRPEINDFGVKVEYFPFDSFDGSVKSADDLVKVIAEFSDQQNIIAASLGPKPSALTLFRLTKLIPSIGLVYIPAKEYNNYYSSGVNLLNATIVEV